MADFKDNPISVSRGIDRQLFDYHPVIGYKFIPDLQVRIQHESGGYLVKTNSLGFRSEFEFPAVKKQGLKRILLFGDSFTAGDGVSNKKRYSDLLMQTLPSTEIFNFGMPGTGTDQQYLIYKRFAEGIEHDLIMIVVNIENIRRVNAKYRFYLNSGNERIVFQKPYFDLENGQLVLKGTPVNPRELKFDELPETERRMVVKGGRFPAVRFIVKKMGLKKIAQKISGYQQYHEYNSPATKEWLLLKAILLSWIGELKKPVLLVPLPTHEYADGGSDYRAIEKRFSEFGRIKDAILYSPYNDIIKLPWEQRRRFRFKYDVHFTPFGHETYAGLLRLKIGEIFRNYNLM